ncbi:MAG: hypothetical protein SGJ17_09570 [Hyphomicrobiales bacterium]|nr:hypothetical protein [Hyphomicrobiales bacterium]
MPEDDYATIAAAADAAVAMQRFDIESRYGEIYAKRFGKGTDKFNDAMREEGVMQTFAAYMRGERFGKAADTIFAQLKKLVDAVRAALGSRGLRTYEDVFEDMATGRLSALDSRGKLNFYEGYGENDGSPAWSRTTAAQPGGVSQAARGTGDRSGGGRGVPENESRGGRAPRVAAAKPDWGPLEGELAERLGLKLAEVARTKPGGKMATAALEQATAMMDALGLPRQALGLPKN